MQPSCVSLSIGKSSVLKSLGGVSSVLTNIILATSPHSPGAAAAEANQKISNKEDAIVMDTKLKIIEILQVIYVCCVEFTCAVCIYVACIAFYI